MTSVELVGLALAIAPTIDLCMKYGYKLKNVCSSISYADAQLSERALRIDNAWMHLEHQLSFARRVEQLMRDDHREIYARTLRSTAEAGRQWFHADRRSGHRHCGTAKSKIGYALRKDSLDKAIDELEVWQRIADQSWYLLMRIADSRIDDALPQASRDVPAGAASGALTPISEATAIRAGLDRTPPINSFGTRTATTGSGLTVDARELERLMNYPILFSSGAVLAQRAFSTGGKATYLLCKIQCWPLSRYDAIKRDARDLARRLQHGDPHSFGLLSCKGVAVPSQVPHARLGVSHPEPAVTFTMIFRVPPRCQEPRTLRELLLRGSLPRSLTERFDLARGLASAVGYVHTFGFVHKAIRPEAVVMFRDLTSGTGHHPRSVFLVGFENFRHEHGQTQRQGDDNPARNIYRHPSRQGPSPREDYVMQHDMYSLGVCLLEIGLWRSLVTYDGEGDHEDMGDQKCVLADVLKDYGAGMLPLSPAPGKDQLLFLTSEVLPQSMGTKYAEIVKTCLTCLDPENEDFGDACEFEDEDGIRIGVRYIEKVLLRINSISV